MRAADPAEVSFAVARVWVTEAGGQAMIRIGPVAGSCCWFAQRIGQRWRGFWIAGDERAACMAVESWMRRRGGVAAWQELARPAGEDIRD
jgi:hypothetical protein